MFISASTDLLRGLAGGALIGASSAALMYLMGKIAGISGILSGAVGIDQDRRYKRAFVVGLLAAGAVAGRLLPGSFSPLSLKPHWLVAAGLLVGFGSRMGSGCTSGHGVCGLARLSPRSLAAVGTFMGTGALIAALVNQPSLRSVFYSDAAVKSEEAGLISLVAPAAAVALLSAAVYCWLPHSSQAQHSSKSHNRAAEPLSLGSAAAALGCASVFGLGLAISGMTSTAKVAGFLDFTGEHGWDLTLAGVMGGAVLVNLAANYFMHGSSSCYPLSQVPKESKPLSQTIKWGACAENMKVDSKLIAGSALFGIGWGLAGICPGPALVSAAAGVAPVAQLFVPAMLLGMLAERRWFA